MEFNDFKDEILRRAKEADACAIDEYLRAYQSNDYRELMQVIKDNFAFAVQEEVIDPALIDAYKDQFAENQIYCNVDVTGGFLLASGDATVKASDNATVIARDNATVEAWDDTIVIARDNATVRARGDATVIARDYATVEAWNYVSVIASDNVSVIASDNVSVIASGNVSVIAWDNVTVEASGNVYVTSLFAVECKLFGNAIYRIRECNTIRYVSDSIKFEKQN